MHSRCFALIHCPRHSRCCARFHYHMYTLQPCAHMQYPPTCSRCCAYIRSYLTHMATSVNLVLARSLVVTAVDRGTPPLVGSATLTVVVMDINDNSPTIPFPWEVRVPESKCSSALCGNASPTARAEARRTPVGQGEAPRGACPFPCQGLACAGHRLSSPELFSTAPSVAAWGRGPCVLGEPAEFPAHPWPLPVLQALWPHTPTLPALSPWPVHPVPVPALTGPAQLPVPSLLPPASPPCPQCSGSGLSWFPTT